MTTDTTTNFAAAYNLTATTKALCSSLLALSEFAGATARIAKHRFSLACYRESPELADSLSMHVPNSPENVRLPRNFSTSVGLSNAEVEYVDFVFSTFDQNLFDSANKTSINGGVTTIAAYETDYGDALDARELVRPLSITLEVATSYNTSFSQRADTCYNDNDLLTFQCPMGDEAYTCDTNTSTHQGPYFVAATCPNFVPTCLWWDWSRLGWRSDGCAMVNYTAGNVTCECTQLSTSFGISTNVSALKVASFTTFAPSQAPTPTPSLAPIPMPSQAPIPNPSLAPTLTPSLAPTPMPSLALAATPSLAPASSPSVSPTPTNSTCFDTSGDALNAHASEDDCGMATYASDGLTACAAWDDFDFTANDMCCVCGGGTNVAPTGSPIPVPSWSPTAVPSTQTTAPSQVPTPVSREILTVSIAVTLAGLSCSSYGTVEEAAFTSGIASSIDLVDEQHIGGTVCSDAARRLSDGRRLDAAVSIGCDISIASHEIDDDNIAAGSDLASVVSTSLSAAVSSGSLASSISDAASSLNSSTFMTMTVLGVEVSTQAPTATPTHAPASTPTQTPTSTPNATFGSVGVSAASDGVTVRAFTPLGVIVSLIGIVSSVVCIATLIIGTKIQARKEGNSKTALKANEHEEEPVVMDDTLPLHSKDIPHPSSGHSDPLRHHFNEFDVDGSGKIEVSELRTLLNAVSGAHPTEEEVQEMMARHDINRDGKLDFGEFKDLYTKIQSGDIKFSAFSDMMGHFNDLIGSIEIDIADEDSEEEEKEDEEDEEDDDAVGDADDDDDGVPMSPTTADLECYAYGIASEKRSQEPDENSEEGEEEDEEDEEEDEDPLDDADDGGDGVPISPTSADLESHADGEERSSEPISLSAPSEPPPDDAGPGASLSVMPPPAGEPRPTMAPPSELPPTMPPPSEPPPTMAVDPLGRGGSGHGRSRKPTPTPNEEEEGVTWDL